MNVKKKKSCLSKFQGKPFAFTWNYSEFFQKCSLERKLERTLAAASQVPGPFVHMGCSWPSCEACPLAAAQIPSAPSGEPALSPRRATWERGCEILNWGASVLSSAFAEIPSKNSRLLPFPPKRALAGNPQKSARKGQRGSWGSKQLKIGLPGRQPWRSRSICK